MRINFRPYGRKIANSYTSFPSVRTENNTNLGLGLGLWLELVLGSQLEVQVWVGCLYCNHREERVWSLVLYTQPGETADWRSEINPAIIRVKKKHTWNSRMRCVSRVVS